MPCRSVKMTQEREGTMHRKSEKNAAKNIPSREEVAAEIRNYRLRAGLSQYEIADKLKCHYRSRSWYVQIETNQINPYGFYGEFVYLYGREAAISVFGGPDRIDWDMYRSDRLATYYAFYDINRSISCETLEISFTSLRFMLAQKNRYVLAYKEGFDKVFPHLKRDAEILRNFHAVGKNSLAEIDAKNNCAYIRWNCAKHRTVDTIENRQDMNREIQELLKWHKAHDGKPETGIIDFPNE